MRNLEERVREYELRGVQASIWVQTAAKSVVRENARLRSLLRRRGVKDAEVESYLYDNTHGSDDGTSVGNSAQSILTSSTRSICGQDHLNASSSNRSHQKLTRELSQQDCADKIQPLKSDILGAQEDEDGPQPSTLPNSDQSIESQRLQARTPWPPSQEFPMGLHWSTDRFEKVKGSHHNMTSCIKAAMIIVSMNSGVSINEAKAELGCPPSSDCYVDNLTLFRVMDR